VNFADNQGFAVLGANAATEPVYCITESGSFSIEKMQEIASIIMNPPSAEHPVVPMQPFDPNWPGPGMEAALPEWIIANDIFTKDSDSDGTPDVLEPGYGDSDYDGIPNWIDDSDGDGIVDGNDPDDDNDGIPDKDDPDIDGDGVNEPVQLNPGNNLPHFNPDENYKTSYGQWKDGSKIWPLLGYNKWHQWYPYNFYCPDHCPAGCQAISLVQLIACNEWPAPSTIVSSVTSTWDEMKRHGNNWYDSLTDYARKARIQNDLAVIIREIGNHNNMKYGTEGSSATTEDAEAYMKRYYKNVSVSGYDQNAVRTMVRMGLPVWIRATCDDGGHAWTIDGLLSQEREVTYTYPPDARYPTGYKSTTTVTRELVHCNWGWSGSSNGYYVSGLFNLQPGPAKREHGIDDIDDGYDTDNFDEAIKIIKYTR
jgi:hypothetical protein